VRSSLPLINIGVRIEPTKLMMGLDLVLYPYLRTFITSILKLKPFVHNQSKLLSFFKERINRKRRNKAGRTGNETEEFRWRQDKEWISPAKYSARSARSPRDMQVEWLIITAVRRYRVAKLPPLDCFIPNQEQNHEMGRDHDFLSYYSNSNSSAPNFGRWDSFTQKLLVCTTVIF